VSYDPELIKAVMVTAEIYGKGFSAEAAEMFVSDLGGHPTQSLLRALTLCRRELRSFPTVADIIARVDDGRPGVEEAWALLPRSEDDSVVWTDEMAEAYGVSRCLSDPVAARMAFREKYLALVTEARRNRRQARWTPSLGHDKKGQETALKEAVDRGRISAPQAAALLPDGVADPKKGLLMIGTDIPIEDAHIAQRARELALLVAKDNPKVLGREQIRQNCPTPSDDHTERVRQQLEELKRAEMAEINTRVRLTKLIPVEEIFSSTESPNT
jgi:hypothetical protein